MARRIGQDVPFSLGVSARARRIGQLPAARSGDVVVDLGAECARLAERDGWENMPAWCRDAASGDPGYALARPVPGSLGWAPPAVRIAGIPNPVAAPTASARTWRRIPIRENEAGTGDTLRVMCGMAAEAATDPQFVEDARAIPEGRARTADEYAAIRRANREALGLPAGGLGSVGGSWVPAPCAARDYACVVASDLEFVRRNVRYSEGPLGTESDGSQLFQYLASPGWTLFVSGAELCAGMSSLLLGLMMAQGVRGRLGLRCYYLDPARTREASHVVATWNGMDVDAVPSGSRVGDSPPRALWVREPLEFTCAMS